MANTASNALAGRNATCSTKPTAEMVRKIVRYEPDTGRLFWLKRGNEMFASEAMRRRFNKHKAGNEAFLTVDGSGYRSGVLFGRMYLAHRVIWLISYGEWPSGQIDHINGDQHDNRLSNLREVGARQNARNQRRAANNTTGICGVVWHKKMKKWYARISTDGGRKELGLFSCFGQAVRARKRAEREYGYSATHGSPSRPRYRKQ